MPYLIVDPVDDYPAQMMEFLGERSRGAVAVFSTNKRWALWQHKWKERLGEWVLDEYLATQAPNTAVLAARIGRDWTRLEGVIPWDEISILLGTELGDRLNLGWNSLEVIERCRDKAVMKAWLRNHRGIRINASREVEEASEALAFQQSLGTWPIVVKPTGGSGSTDVYFAQNSGDLLRNCQQVLQSGSGQVLLEEYIGGEEYCVNGVVDRKGDFLVTDVWHYDRRESHGVPNLYYATNKVPRSESLFDSVGFYAAQVVEALGVIRAPIHMEVKVDERGPCLIEVGARLGGGNLPKFASILHGRSIFELAACHYITNLSASGRDVDWKRYDQYYASMLSGIQEETLPKIRSINAYEEVQELESFQSFGVIRPPGRPAFQTVDLDTTAWEVFLIHSDLGQLQRDAHFIRQNLYYQ